MPFIGNDIVDLTDPENKRKIRDTRFINRVLTPGEQKLIHASRSPGSMLWSIWACKEAAYKALSKARSNEDKVSSSPLRYSVSFDKPFTFKSGAAGQTRVYPGKVAGPECSIPVRVVRKQGYVHAVAATGSEDAVGCVMWTVCKINLKRSEVTPAMRSLLVRKALKMRLAKNLGIDTKDMEIIRPESDGKIGPPLLMIGGKISDIEVSLTHDGQYVAYAYAFREGAPGGVLPIPARD